MAYRLITAQGKTQLFYVEAVAQLFQTIWGGEVEFIDVANIEG
jgi:hypothetical protein